ncbi:MAG TPA: hypothetical protein VIF88_09120 [Methylocystis sp.]|jgi:hypothetical protein
MFDEYFGLAEMVLSFGLIIGICVWQLWSLQNARRRLRDKQSKFDDRR